MQPTITAEYLKSQGLSKKFEKSFWDRVDKNGPIPQRYPELGPCWIWIGTFISKGYGRINHIVAHRGAWLLRIGPIQNGLNVLHKCDNRACVNTDHLFLGTHRDNYWDAVAKGRRSNCGPKLTQEKAIHIRNEYQKGSTTMQALADLHGVSLTAIDAVIHSRTWVTL